MRRLRRRRLLIAGSALLAAPIASLAQQARTARIGFLISETLTDQKTRVDALLAGLREYGYVEGRNIAIELQHADGNYERLRGLAAELAAHRVDVLVAFGAKAGVAAKDATATIPVVVTSITDPVALGIVNSLPRPGGNVTGISNFAEIGSKQIELLKEAVPRIERIAVLKNAANPFRPTQIESMRATAKSLKLEMETFEVRSSKEFGGAFAAIAKRRIEAVWVSGDTLFQGHFREIATLADKHRLPAVGRLEFADAGGLIGYGVDDAGQFRRAAYFVDRILKGARPDQLPVERATRIELVLNAKTAKAFGIKIPQSLLLRADRVID